MASITTDLTADMLQQELLAAEKALQANELKRQAWDENDVEPPEPVAARLSRLEATTNELLLTQQIAEWKKQYAEHSSNIREEALQLEILADILLGVEEKSELYARLVEDDFLPFCAYLHDQLQLSLRQTLQQSNYPSSEGCSELVSQKETRGGAFQSILHTCESIYRLVDAYRQVVRHVGFSDSLGHDAVVLELCRPFVERVEFHFIHNADNRSTTNRIERLPELLFMYLKEHVTESGPWALVYDGLFSSSLEYCARLPLDFLNEILGLVQHVIVQRNYFRHPTIVGSDSKPALLMNAIEQFIRFDDYTKSLLNQPNNNRLLKLMDVFVVGDDELLCWWLEREREYVFSTLFGEQISGPLISRVSPRAELFCSLIRSIQAKAEVFSFSGPYLSRVAAPLCMQFVDAVDESSAILRDQLGARSIPSDAELTKNINRWIELINGTHMAALILNTDVDETAPASLGDHQDLARFGRSLESLESVLVDEFTKVFVGTVLLERAKLAAYLVRCPHLLSTDDPVFLESVSSTSELDHTRRLLQTFLKVCNDTAHLDIDGEAEAMERSQHAPKLIRERVLDVLAAKLLEVALDMDDMTPELLPAGCSIFANDVVSLFGNALVPPSVLRLLELAKVMAMPSLSLSQIGEALSGLADQGAPLALHHFTVDERLYEEAVSMVQAKGLVWLEFGDILNVLNRRRDIQ